MGPMPSIPGEFSEGNVGESASAAFRRLVPLLGEVQAAGLMSTIVGGVSYSLRRAMIAIAEANAPETIVDEAASDMRDDWAEWLHRLFVNDIRVMDALASHLDVLRDMAADNMRQTARAYSIDLAPGERMH